MNNIMKRMLAKKITAIGYCLLVIVLASCSNDDYLGGHSTTDGAGAAMSVASAQSLTAGDHIGIFASKGSLDPSTRNRDYVVQSDGRTLKVSTGDEFYVKGNVDILAYYPFQGSDGAEPELLLNSYTDDGSALVDYQLAKVSGVGIGSAQGITLNFAPCLSKLNITIQPISGESVSRYVLSGVYRRGRIDPYSFSISPEDLIDYDATGSGITSISLTAIPQTLASGQAVLKLQGQLRTYIIPLPQVTIAPNSTCNATVNMVDGQVTYELVNNDAPWTDSGLGGDVTSSEVNTDNQ